MLDQAVALRRRLDVQVASLGADAAKMLLVIGHAPFTPGGFAFGDNGLEYTDAVGGGDGRVPLTKRDAARRSHLEARRDRTATCRP